MPWPRAAYTVKAVFQPIVLVKAFLRRFPLGSFQFRLALDGFRRPWYAYGVYHAADLARRLGIERISVIEFGVAGGDGLVELEKIAAEVEALLSIRIDVFGFDTGSGLPQETDYRDLPYFWRRGQYQMDIDRVRGRLTRAKLILGDVGETIPELLRDGLSAPIGFIAFDLDYYSSTVSAFRIFEGDDSRCLPRVLSYFDDVQSGEHIYHCEDAGELLAIREFNESPGRHHRIRAVFDLAGSLPLQPTWAERMFVYHRFDHIRYNSYIGADG
jgi:hypothetical protein